jgi:hypothetical protein
MKKKPETRRLSLDLRVETLDQLVAFANERNRKVEDMAERLLWAGMLALDSMSSMIKVLDAGQHSDDDTEPPA